MLEEKITEEELENTTNFDISTALEYIMALVTYQYIYKHLRIDNLCIWTKAIEIWFLNRYTTILWHKKM